jgi:hypothetical protein
MKTISKLISLLAAIVLTFGALASSVSSAYAMPEKSVAMATAHGFDLAAICRRAYLYTGTQIADLASNQYQVGAQDPNNAYSLRCRRVDKVPVISKNHADGIGNWIRTPNYAWGEYGFDLNAACKKMNPNGRLQLGSPTNPWSWSCVY